MSRLESCSNPGQDRPRPSTSSECHHIFPLCAELSEAASCLPADTPDAIKKFCETVLQKLPKDASGIKSFQIELFNSLLVDLCVTIRVSLPCILMCVLIAGCLYLLNTRLILAL